VINGQTTERLNFVVGDAFFPAGAPHLRIQFKSQTEGMTATIVDHDPIVTGIRIDG